MILVFTRWFTEFMLLNSLNKFLLGKNLEAAFSLISIDSDCTLGLAETRFSRPVRELASILNPNGDPSK
jgi:hypothetical protein